MQSLYNRVVGYVCQQLSNTLKPQMCIGALLSVCEDQHLASLQHSPKQLKNAFKPEALYTPASF